MTNEQVDEDMEKTQKDAEQASQARGLAQAIERKAWMQDETTQAFTGRTARALNDILNEVLNDNPPDDDSAIGEALKILITRHPDEAAELKRMKLCTNKAYICGMTDYLAWKQNPDNDSGYTCNVFKQANNEKKEIRPIVIPMGTLSYIGAQTHRGKTTVLTSLAVDAITQALADEAAGKKPHRVVFITSEEHPNMILDRMLSAILYTRYNRTLPYVEDIRGAIDYNLKTYTKRPQPVPEPTNLQDMIYSSYEELADRLNSGLFAVIDHIQHHYFDDLAEMLDDIDDRSIVLVDYLQHLRTLHDDEKVSNRQVLLQHLSHELADIASKKNLITISAAQFGRKGNDVLSDKDKYSPDLLDLTLFREAGDIEQDAHLAIGVGQQVLSTKMANDTVEVTHRFYEVLKQRYHPQDTNRYSIIDQSKFSLYLPETYNDNGVTTLKPFEPVPVETPPSDNSTGSRKNRSKSNAPTAFGKKLGLN